MPQRTAKPRNQCSTGWSRTNDDRTGWAYEGFLFEARDSHGVPFVATFNRWRGPHDDGGQWAADPTLIPFPHG